MDTRPSSNASKSSSKISSKISSKNSKSGPLRSAASGPDSKRQNRVSVVSSGKTSHAAHSRVRAADIRRRRRLALFTLYAILGVEIGLALVTSPALAIKKVRVYGIDALPSAERTQTLHALQVANATNWFRTPLRRMREETKALPWVRSARVDPAFSTTLTAHIEPREPFIILKVGQAYFETDAVGTIIRTARPIEKQTLPHVVFEQSGTLIPGDLIGDPALSASIQVLQQLPQAQVRKITKIVIDQTGNICLNMLGGMQLQLGQAENVSGKISRIKSIYALDPAIAQTLAAINLSCPSAPACTLRVAQSAPPMIGPMPPLSNVIP